MPPPPLPRLRFLGLLLFLAEGFGLVAAPSSPVSVAPPVIPVVAPSPNLPPLPKPVFKIDVTAVSEGRAASGPIASYADVIEPVQKAVVSIYATKFIGQSVRALPLRLRQLPESERKEEGLGSGVIISPNGYILTNNHVVADSDELRVLLTDGREFKARLVGTDEKTDIAVICIEGENLPAVTLANSDKLRVGDIVFAIGNPLGVGQTVTSGIISAKGRNNLGLLEDVGGYEDFIQTDAAINMGNSGGALIDTKGRLIGINSAIISPSSGNIGIAFSIPINLAASIVRSLIDNRGKVPRGYLGVAGETLTSELTATHKLPKNIKGVLVTDVPADGPAGKAGLKLNDVITSISDHPIASLEDLRLTVSQIAPGTTVSVLLIREGTEKTFKVGLTQLPERVAAANELLPGVVVAPVDATQRRQYSLAAGVNGLVVTALARESPYYLQLAEGAVIQQIDQKPVSDVSDARKLLQPGPRELSVYYRRMVSSITITIR